jgi:putative nucleotidyltransferase with HDIG domain
MMSRSQGEAFEREQPIRRQADDPVLADRGRAEQVDVPRATFRGDVYSLVLQSCLTLTDAQRGVYLKTTGQGIRVKANVCVDSSPLGGAPSTFMEALARRVLERGEAIVFGGADTRELPAPSDDERFETCAAIPVSMRGDQHGVLIVLDKSSGYFDEADFETLLHIGDQATVAVDNAQLQRELEEAYLGTVGMLADAVETKDPYTSGHCEQVSHFALGMARELGLDERASETVRLAALLHDVGKICISDGILNKPGPLLPEEREVVKAHARIGAELMRNLPALASVAEVVLHHHEHYDGGGYPDGLVGDDIPIGSRIVAVIDSYCAMIDRRSYKASLGNEESRAELLRCAGTQFEPALVDAFLRVLDAQAATPGSAAPDFSILPQVRRHREASVGPNPRRRGT